MAFEELRKAFQYYRTENKSNLSLATGLGDVVLLTVLFLLVNEFIH